MKMTFARGLVAVLAVGATQLATSTPAQASGWGTIKSATVAKSLSRSSWTSFNVPFSSASNVAYRYCVVGRGTGSANLQPTAFGTTVTFSSSTNVTRCTKSYSGGANNFAPTGALLSGSVYIQSAYVQRYYTGPIPV